MGPSQLLIVGIASRCIEPHSRWCDAVAWLLTMPLHHLLPHTVMIMMMKCVLCVGYNMVYSEAWPLITDDGGHVTLGWSELWAVITLQTLWWNIGAESRSLLSPMEQHGNVSSGICLYVCNTDNLRKPRHRKFIFSLWVHFEGDTDHVRIWRSCGQGQGHRSKKAQNDLYLQCKISMRNKSGSTEDTAMKFVCSMGFSIMADRMVWLCYMSGSDHAD